MNRKDILIILAVACAVVFVWINISVYQAANSSKLSAAITGEIEPIQPVFDQIVIDEVKSRTLVDPVYQMTPSSASASVNQSAASSSNTPSSLTP